MKHYTVTAKFGSDTMKFPLSAEAKQSTRYEALQSAREEAAEAFGYKLSDMIRPDALSVTVTETAN